MRLRVVALAALAATAAASLPLAATPTMTLETLTPLPEASGGAGLGIGFSATGLALDPLTGGWVVGNDGRAQDPQETHDPSIVFLDAFGALIREVRLAPLYPGHGSVQGVAVDPRDGDIWYAARNNNLIRKIDRVDGAERVRFRWPTPNGLFVDADETLWILTDDAVSHVTQEGAALARFAIERGDGLIHVGSRLWIANGDRAEAYDDHTGARVTRLRLQGVNYAEGLVVCGDRLWVIHNGAFHRTSHNPATPPYSVLAAYTLPHALQTASLNCPRAQRVALRALTR